MSCKFNTSSLSSQASTSCSPTVTSISESIDDTVLYKSLSSTVSGMPDSIKLFLLPYWSR